MATIKLNVTPEKVEASTETKTETTTVVVTKSFQDKIPANWVITPTETGIEAYSNQTRETFNGSLAEFNKMLRG